MKKYLKHIIIMSIIGIIILLTYNINRKINYKTEVTERIKSIPSFSFSTLNNYVFTKNELTKDLFDE